MLCNQIFLSMYDVPQLRRREQLLISCTKSFVNFHKARVQADIKSTFKHNLWLIKKNEKTLDFFGSETINQRIYD